MSVGGTLGEPGASGRQGSCQRSEPRPAVSVSLVLGRGHPSLWCVQSTPSDCWGASTLDRRARAKVQAPTPRAPVRATAAPVPTGPGPPPHSALHFPRVSIAFRGPGGTQDSHLVPPRATPGPLPMAAGSSQGYLGGARPRVPWGIRPRAVSLSGLSASCKGRTPSPEPAGGRKQRLVRDPEGAGQAWPRGQGSGCRGPQGCLCPFGVSMSPQAGQDHPPGAAWPQQSPAPLPTAGPGQAFRSQPWPPGGASLVFARGLGAAGRGERGEQGRPLFSCAQEPASGQGPGDEGPPSSGRWARRRHAQSRSERAGAGRGHKPASDTRFSACCASFNSRSLS